MPYLECLILLVLISFNTNIEPKDVTASSGNLAHLLKAAMLSVVPAHTIQLVLG